MEKTINKHMKQILKAISRIDMPKLIFWLNADAGSEEISTAIREYREKKLLKMLGMLKNLDHELLFQVLKLTKCLVGNTSAAIREGWLYWCSECIYRIQAKRQR